MHATPCSATPADAGRTELVSAEDALEAIVEAGIRLDALGLQGAAVQEEEAGVWTVSFPEDGDQVNASTSPEALDLLSAALVVAAEALRARGQVRQGTTLSFRVVKCVTGGTNVCVTGGDVPLVVPLQP